MDHAADRRPSSRLEEAVVALADGQFRGCCAARDFIGTTVRPIAERVVKDDSTPLRATFFGALLRTHAWAQSLGKLTHPSDFQAALAGSRALFEMAVDLTLLHFDPKAHPHVKMVAWEESAKLLAAERVQEHFGAAQVPDEFEGPMRFLKEDANRVRDIRIEFWPETKGKHPPRWTGKGQAADATRATSLFPKGEFDLYYAANYAHASWFTHGSALTGIRVMPESTFPALSGFAFKQAAELLVIISEIVLRGLDRWDSIAEQRDAHVRSKILRLVGEAARPYVGTPGL